MKLLSFFVVFQNSNTTYLLPPISNSIFWYIVADTTCPDYIFVYNKTCGLWIFQNNSATCTTHKFNDL